jgi:hypothetical protein
MATKSIPLFAGRVHSMVELCSTKILEYPLRSVSQSITNLEKWGHSLFEFSSPVKLINM